MFRWRFIFRYYRIIKLKAMSELYWITVLGKIGNISAVFTLIGGAASVFLTTIFIASVCDYVDDELKSLICKIRNTAYVIFCASLVLTVLIPSKKDLYMIYGVGKTMDYLKFNPTARKLPDKCVKAFDKWVDQITEDDKPKHE